jgi:cytochrome d ubiquinol oxidase subunit II
MEIYLLLKVIWWVLLGVLLMGLGVMVGMDMGVGTILRYVGRNDIERRVVSTASARTGTATRCGSSSAAARSSPPSR